MKERIVYQVEPTHGDGDRPDLPLPAVPDPGVVGAVVKVKHKEDGSHIAEPLHHVLNAEVQAAGLKIALLD
jgi:hypothetical protein